MAMMEERTLKSQGETVHNVILENRQKVSISGVEDVDSFDEAEMIIQTNMGTVSLKGENLHINKFNVDTGELVIEGDVDEFVYHDDGGYGKKGRLVFQNVWLGGM